MKNRGIFIFWVFIFFIVFLIWAFVLVCRSQDSSYLQIPNLPVIIEEYPSISEPQYLAIPDLPQVTNDEKALGTYDFSGGLNVFMPSDMLGIKEAQDMLNLVPKGNSLEKRKGTQRIQFTGYGSVYGMAFTDSGGIVTKLVVVSDDDIYWSDSSSNWELIKFGTTSDTIHYFTSTPFGLIVANGSDSTRIWDSKGYKGYKGLGVCDSGWCDFDSIRYSSDTVRIVDTSKVWDNNYWIGYFVKDSTTGNIREIIDNGYNWIDYLKLSAGDTATSKYFLISRPDSQSTGRCFPHGIATAYFEDRLFVSSTWYKNRLYYSQPRLLSDIDPDAWINLDMAGYDYPVAMRVFNGFLVVFGQFSLHVIDVNLVSHCISKVVGCVAPKSIALGDNYIYFRSDRGIMRFEPNVYASYSFVPEKISDPINAILNAEDQNHWSSAGGYYGDKEYWYSYAEDSCIVYDERTQSWFKQSFGFTDAVNYSGIINKGWNEYLYPSANADTNLWDVSSGAHWDAINDYNNALQYIYTSTDGEYEQFQFTNTVQFASNATPKKVSFQVYARNATDASYLNVYLYMQNATGGRTYMGAFYPIQSTWRQRGFSKTTNPATGLAWTKTDLDDLVLTLESDGTDQIQVASLYVIPYYETEISAGNFLFSSPEKIFTYTYGSGFVDDTTTTGQAIYGKPIMARYKTGWFNPSQIGYDGMLSIFGIDLQKDTGEVKIYYYKDFETTVSDSSVIAKGGNRGYSFDLAPIIGEKFQIEVIDQGDVDTLVLKGWSAQVGKIGKREE